MKKPPWKIFLTFIQTAVYNGVRTVNKFLKILQSNILIEFTLISFVPNHCIQPVIFKNLIFRPAQCPLPRRSKCHEVPSHSCIKVPLSKESPLPPWSRQQRSCSKLPPSIVWPQLFLASRKENVRFPDSPDFDNFPDFRTRRDVR